MNDKVYSKRGQFIGRVTIECNGRECGHQDYGNSPHCAEMHCPNYINKCAKHGLTHPA